MSLREQLKLLEELQQVDLQLSETEESLAALPQKLQSLKDDVARVEKLLEAERGQLEEALAYKAGRQQEIKEEQDLLQKTKSKLAAVRTSKEYLAIQREFEANRKMTGEREEEVAKLMEAIEKFQTSIASHEEELQELRSHVEQEEAETEKAVGELQARAKAQRADRDGMAAAIPKSAMRKYDAIRRRRGGKAVVPAARGVCTGCNMQLPPQLYNIIQAGDTIEQCPNCQRIVYFPDPDENGG